MRLALFVSPHGFGHATRSAAVLNALHRRRPGLEVEIFTTVPEWVFTDSLTVPFRQHPVLTDVGMVQRDAMQEDPRATAAALEAFLPLTGARLEAVARRVKEARCRLVVADISPLGLAVARRLGLPSVLIENFTWDWIYQAYLHLEPRLGPLLESLAEWFAGATMRIQTEPTCCPLPTALRVAPVSRRARADRLATRRRLGVPPDAPMVLVSMGGIPWSYRDPERLATVADVWFVVPGGAERPESRGRVVLLPHHSRFYHPDLMAASDAVAGKLGYSTVAEAYNQAVRFAFIERRRFPESPVLASFVFDRLPSLRLPPDALENPDWVHLLPALLAQDVRRPVGRDGADEAADHLAQLL